MTNYLETKAITKQKKLKKRMAQNRKRKLAIGAVDLVKIRLKNIGPVMVSLSDEIGKVLVDSTFFSEAPFSWISLIIRNGLENKTTPIFGRISKKYGDLPISVEVDAHALLDAETETVKAIYRFATIDALIEVADKYHLPKEALEKYRTEFKRPTK